MQKVEVEAILKAAKRIAILQKMEIERGLELRPVRRGVQRESLA